ncbi:MAG: hypothetical protein IT464_16355 [Planctomycetes bacterium]|nr:hypothetical protein [Planctomycetota bacterium]
MAWQQPAMPQQSPFYYQAPPPSSQYAPSQHSPLAYPAMQPPPGYNMPPAPPRRMPGWAIGLLAGAAGLIVLVLFGVGIWLLPKPTAGGSEAGGRAVPTSEWRTYNDPDGNFSAKFPGHPLVLNKAPAAGPVVRGVRYEDGRNFWEVVWVPHNKPGGMHVDLNEFMLSFADKAQASVTKSESQSHQGLPGRYGEMANGRIKILLFQAHEMLWIVASGEHSSSFEFFAENMRLSDKGRGINPLVVRCTSERLLYEASECEFVSCRVEGGTPPYDIKLNGNVPAGLGTVIDARRSNTSSQPPSLPYQTYSLRGKATASGDYRFEVTVHDSEGRSAVTDAQVTVKPMPEQVASIEGRTYSYKHWSIKETPVAAAGTTHIDTHVGLRIACVYQALRLADLKYDTFVIAADEVPDWMSKSEINAEDLDGPTPGFIGSAPAPGEYKLKLRLIACLHGTNHDYSYPIEFTIAAAAIPNLERPASVGKIVWNTLSASEVHTYVKHQAKGYFHFVIEKPDNWNDSREWKVEKIRWPDLEEVSKQLPPGVGCTVHSSQISLSGNYAQAGEWEVRLTLIVYVKFIDEPFELTYKVKFVVKQ